MAERPEATAEQPEPYGPGDDALERILQEARTIAVVGLSSNPERYSHTVAQYLQRHGYRVIPVNPTEEEVLGERSHAALSDVTEPVDVVDVFRPPRETPDIARQAAAIGAKVLWLQQGIVSEEARRIAEEAGVDVIMGMCIRTTHRRLGV